MQMNDSQRIPASKEKVWAALNNPDILKQCIPGCQSLEMTNPNEMTATVVLKVGPVKATFGGKVTLSDLDPPNSYRITGEGSGFGSDTNRVVLLARDGSAEHLPLMTKREVADALLDRVAALVAERVNHSSE